VSRLRNFLFAANRPLQDRLAILIASAVAAAVAVTGIAAYAMTLLTVYNQFDNELVEVASITSGALSEDLENMGGIDTSAWRAARRSRRAARSAASRRARSSRRRASASAAARSRASRRAAARSRMSPTRRRGASDPCGGVWAAR